MATLFYAAPTALANFTDGSPISTNAASGESVAYNGTAGPTGAGAVVVTTVTTSVSGASEVGVRASVTGGSGRSFKWSFMVPSAGVLNSAAVTNFIWSSSGSGNYGATIAQVGITQGRTQSGTTGSSGNYRMFLQTPLDSYANLYYAGLQMTRNTRYNIELRLSNDQIMLYIQDSGTGIWDGQCYIRGTTGSYYNGLQFGAVTLGKVNNASGTNYGYAGTLNFAQVGLYSITPPTQQSGASNVFADLWAAKVNRELRHDGAIVRHMGYAPGSTGDGGYGYSSTDGSDIVSEGQAYGALAAVQAGDQTNFNKIVNFAYQTLCRRNTAIASAQNNATISGGTTTYAPNLMGYKYQDDIGGFWDGNPATDAEVDMMKAYFLAHGRWGSGSNSPGSDYSAPNYKQRGINLAHDLITYCFTTGTDSSSATIQLQSADAINGINEMNPSYFDPWSLRLAAQYDTTNTTYWGQALNGAYEILASNQLLDSYSGPTEWVKWTNATNGVATYDTGRDSQNGRGYSYNAFRTPHRVYYDYYFYNESRAYTYLTGGFRSFSTTEYNSNGFFVMEKTNTGGSNTTPAYEKTANTFGQWVTQKLGTPTSISATVHSTKLNWSTLYQPGENGAYIQDAPGGVDSYFMDYWGMFSYAIDNGALVNYNGSTVQRSAGFTMDSVLHASSNLKTTGFTLNANLKKLISKLFTLDAVLQGSSSPVGTPISTPGIAPLPTTLDGLASWCMLQIGRNDSAITSVLYQYLNQAQKDWEMEFADHVQLQRSRQIQLVGPVNGVPQDLSYDFYTQAVDFRKERFLRIVSPINYSRPLVFTEYTQFRRSVLDIALTTTGLPSWWYWSPEDPNGFHVWPVPDQAYVLQFDYIAYAPELLNATDTPFMDREFHKALCFQALFYYYSSQSVALPDQAGLWGGLFEAEKRRYQKDIQRRQIQTITAQYGTGVNEGRRRKRIPSFH